MSLNGQQSVRITSILNPNAYPNKYTSQGFSSLEINSSSQFIPHQIPKVHTSSNNHLYNYILKKNPLYNLKYKLEVIQLLSSTIHYCLAQLNHKSPWKSSAQHQPRRLVPASMPSEPSGGQQDPLQNSWDLINFFYTQRTQLTPDGTKLVSSLTLCRLMNSRPSTTKLEKPLFK